MIKITVRNPNKLPVIDYRAVKPLQGDLKDLNAINYRKLKNVLEKRGFDVPLMLWKKGKDFFLLDGHQRQRVMTKEDMQPYEVPYLIIEAKDEAAARVKLLEISSQYGTITQQGFDMFTAELPEVELQELNFDRLYSDPSTAPKAGDQDNDDDSEVDAEALLKEEKTVECPRCKFEFEPSA